MSKLCETCGKNLQLPKSVVKYEAIKGGGGDTHTHTTC